MLAPVDTMFDAILDFLASSPSAAQIVDYQPSAVLQDRVDDLLEKNRKEGLNEAKQAEMEKYLNLNRFVSRLKIKARARLRE